MWTVSALQRSRRLRKQDLSGENSMDIQKEKCVVVIDETLPIGMAANTAAILGLTIGTEGSAR